MTNKRIKLDIKAPIPKNPHGSWLLTNPGGAHAFTHTNQIRQIINNFKCTGAPSAIDVEILICGVSFGFALRVFG